MKPGLSCIDRARRAAILGWALLLISAVPLLLQACELLSSHLAYTRYRVRRIAAPEYSFQGHSISMGDASVEIDGRRYLRSTDSKIAIVELTDLASINTRAGIVEWSGRFPRESWRYRIVWINRSGELTQESFTFRERSRFLYRTILAKFVSPSPIGFFSDALVVWPTIYYPVLYPWITSTVGVILLLVTLRRQKGRRTTMPGRGPRG